MTNILSQLSTAKGERTGNSNKLVAEKSIENPKLLNDINIGLKEKDRKIVADCAEVMTMVSEKHPEHVAPFVEDLVELINHKDNRVRWEATHALAFITKKTPDHIQHILPELKELIRNDKSVIVRDYCTLILQNYASINKERAIEIFPMLKSVLEFWGERHAKQALAGLVEVFNYAPDLGEAIRVIATEYIDAKKKTVQSVARKLIKAIDKFEN
jgi:hypothetical protein